MQENITRAETLVVTRLKKSEMVLFKEIQRETGMSRHQVLKVAVREFLERRVEAA